MNIIYLSLLLLLNSTNANEHERSDQDFQNSSCHEDDFICHFVDFTRSQKSMRDEKFRAELTQELFLWIDNQEDNEHDIKQNNFHRRSDTRRPGNSAARLQAFIKMQIKRRERKRATSRAHRAAARLAIAADCERPAVVCIASTQTCKRWDDTGDEINHAVSRLAKILTERLPENGSRDGWAAHLKALGTIKGALLLVEKNPNILANINWFSSDISPRGTIEASDCVYLITETKEDALFILSESAWSASARYVIVIMKQLRNADYGDFTEILYEDNEGGRDVNDVVFEEFDLHNHKDIFGNKTEDVIGDRRRYHNTVSKKNQTGNNSDTIPGGKCQLWSHNLLRLVWYKRRLLHIAVYLSGCNHPGISFIRYNVSTFPVYLLSHSGEGIVLSGEDIVTTLKMLRKPLTNLGGRTLRVSLFERKPTAILVPANDAGPPKFAGQDAWLMSLSARALNFRVVVQEPEDNLGFGHFFENGTSSGSMRNLLQGKVDISFNGFLVMDYGTRAVEFSSPFSFDEVCIVVPQAGALPGWAALLTALPPIIIAVTPPTILGLTLLLTAIRRLLRFRGSLVSDLLNVVSVCLSVSTRLPKLCSQRLLLLGAMVASLVIAGAFQGLIVRSLALPRYPTQIDTLEALDESGLYIATASETLKSIFDVPGSSATMKRLLKKTVVFTTQEEWTESEGRVGRIVRRAGIESDMSSTEHLVKECPRHYPVAFLMRRGSPIEGALNSLLLRFASAGITSAFNFWTHGVTETRRNTETPRKVFSLGDLQGPFIILGCGLGFSAIVFLFEIRVLRCDVTKRRNFMKRRITRRISI